MVLHFVNTLIKKIYKKLKWATKGQGLIRDEISIFISMSFAAFNLIIAINLITLKGSMMNKRWYMGLTTHKTDTIESHSLGNLRM
tara:strand:- start:15 stop:269 length:255 start_codon:yes stop_codon:yes gene_type:complete